MYTSVSYMLQIGCLIILFQVNSVGAYSIFPVRSVVCSHDVHIADTTTSYCGDAVTRSTCITTRQRRAVNAKGSSMGVTTRSNSLVLFGSKYIPPEMDPEYSNIVVRRRSSYEFNQSDPAAAEDFMSYPAPKEGDIVLYTAKWGDKSLGRIRYLRYVDTYGGFFADIVPLEKNSQVNPEGGGDVYVVDRKAQSYFLNVEELQPVKSFFVRKENGYRVYYSKRSKAKNTRNTGEEVVGDELSGWKDAKDVILKAPRYKQVDKSYSPRTKDIDYMQLESDLQDYEDLKARITLTAAQIGAVATLVVGIVWDVNLAVSYALGVASGCVYFYLLGANVESIGESYSALRNKPVSAVDTDTDTASTSESSSSGSSTSSSSSTNSSSNSNSAVMPSKPPGKTVAAKLSRGRLLVPVLLLALLSGKGVLLDGRTPNAFELVPRSVYISAMAGFLTLKLSIFVNEVAQEFKSEDFLGLVPGSLSIVMRKMLLMKTEDNNAELAADVLPTQKVLFVTGPAAAGREALLSELLQQPELRGNAMFRSVPLLTTDERYKPICSPASAVADDDDADEPTLKWYKYVTPQELADLRSAGQLAYEGIDRDGLGNNLQVALTREDVRRSTAGDNDQSTQQVEPAKKPEKGSGWFGRKADREGSQQRLRDFAVLTGPPAMLDALARMDSVVSTNIWISLQTKDQFMDQAYGMVQKQLELDGASGSSNPSDVAKASAEKVTQMVNEAARDINFYMQKAPLFDFTILNIADTAAPPSLNESGDDTTVADDKIAALTAIGTNAEDSNDGDDTSHNNYTSSSYARDELRQILLNLRSS